MSQLLAEAEAENRRINALPDGDDKAKPKQAMQEAQERVAYDTQTREGKTFVNLKPANNMLNSLGEGLYGRLTPDGYGVREADWASAGSTVAGEQQAIERRTLFQDRDLPVLNEYRSVLAGIFRRMYGLSMTDLALIFEGVTPRDLALI